MICRNLYIWLTSSHLGQRLQPLSTIDSSVMEISKSMPAIFGQFSFLSLVCSFLPPYTGTFIGREHNFSFDYITSENNSQNARTKQRRDKYMYLNIYQWDNTRISQNFLQSADLFYNILLTLLNSTWTDHRISPEITRPVTCIFAYWPVRCRIREFTAVLHFTNPFVDCIIVLCP